MASTIIPAFGSRSFTVAAASILSTYSAGAYTVENVGGYAPVPGPTTLAFSGSGANSTSAYGSLTTVIVTAGPSPVSYNIGVTPAVYERGSFQTTPSTLNATGALTTALITNGIVTSTTAAAVAATLDTGTVMDAALTMAVDDSFDWTVIATGANGFTVTAAAGHTVVGTAVVATVTSGRFRTRKTAAATFVTYRIA